ncbi:hypothetical protein QCN27_07235 [Cereibacter sp. SYSU M97828]|nr:hypothetical protein [Cereibacter flavus]
MFDASLRRLACTVTAAAIALGAMTASAVPARADEDTVRTLGGIAAIALGAKIIHDNREKEKERDRWEERRDWNNGRWQHRDRHDRDHDRGRWDRREARLPERCISDYDRRRGEVVAIYNERCLREHARR